MGEDVSYDWEELGYMDSYPEIRNTFDELMGTSKFEDDGTEFAGKKGGFCYINMDRQWTNNSTLKYSFNQLNFYKKLWNNESSLTALNSTAREVFADV